MMTTTDPLDDPRVTIHSYFIEPTGYAESELADKLHFRLEVADGGKWGWMVRRGGYSGPEAMNRKGKWIYERRGSGSNRFRRWPLDEALRIALQHVDQQTINGRTFQQWNDHFITRKAG